MSSIDVGVIITFLIISVIVLFIPLLVYLVRKSMQKTFRRISRFSTVSRILIFSACFIASVWCVRYAVGYYLLVTSERALENLTWYEEIFNSMVHTFQTFSMDEDYTSYITNGKLMLADVFGNQSIWIKIYGIYASLLNVIAPILGGAIIFDILASIFPKIRLKFSLLVFYKEKYYFSELNEASLALAESICKASYKSHKKPILVFTDAYIDENDEKGSEMLLQAKSIGAICVIDDLSHVDKSKLGKRRFFLMDENQSSYLSTISDLTDEYNSQYLKGAEIYIFTNDYSYVEIEERLREKLVDDRHFSEKELPTIIPIDNYVNLITNLLVEVPLYETKINKDNEDNSNRFVTLTVVGVGGIGKEMILTSYWMGQMLDCKLKINVISQETKEYFEDSLDSINPEIRRTTNPNDDILRINRKGDMADVYCDIKYYQCDALSSDFIRILTDENDGVAKSDYFFISSGSDNENMTIANTVKQHVGERHILSDENLKTIITYVVYDTELSDLLNRKRFYSFKDNTYDVYMQAVGNLRDVYSITNIFHPQYNPFAQKAYESYSTIQNRDSRSCSQKNRKEDMHNYLNQISRLLHLKYKIFSMGLYKGSLFDFVDSNEKHIEEIARAYYEYKRVVSGNIEFESPEKEKEYTKLINRMAWLEHRKWNAFMRVQGFCQASNYDAYATPGVIGSFVQTEIKLTPCLVECDQNGIKTEVSPDGEISENSIFCSESIDDFDLLDDLSYELKNKKLIDYDLKQYEYPIYTVIQNI